MSAPRFEIRSHLRPWGRRWTFALVAANNEVIATSEPYHSEQAARDGAKLVQALAPKAGIGSPHRR